MFSPSRRRAGTASGATGATSPTKGAFSLKMVAEAAKTRDPGSVSPPLNTDMANSDSSVALRGSSNNNNNNNTGNRSPRSQQANNAHYSRSTSPPEQSLLSSPPAVRERRNSMAAKIDEVWSHGVKRHLAIVTMDKTGTITSCNNAARILFGYPVGGMVGIPVAKLMPAAIASVHQSYVDRYVQMGLSMGAIGAWKVRSAVRMDGEPFEIRIALSVAWTAGQPVFSSLIDPLFEAAIKTDDKGKILRCEGSCWLLFGVYRDGLVGQQVGTVLRHESDWFSVKEQVVQCKNSDGEVFAALLRIKREKDGIVGKFSEAPQLRVKITVLETGVIADCSGESKALLGYKPKALKGKALTELLAEEELAHVSLDKKVVIQMHHRDKRMVFVTIRVTKTKDPAGRTIYEAQIKGKRSGDIKALVRMKGQKLRYGGEVFGWYELGPNLGHGMCGPVKRAVHRLTGEEVAIKTLSKGRYNEMNMKWPPPKLELMDSIRHPNLVRMFDTIWTGDNIFVVMELIDGGEFFEYIERAGALPENEARVFWRQLVSGIDYLHRMNICHRDVKLENLVLDSNHNLKLIDFGFACVFSDKEDLDVFCGSPDYAAPELVAAQKYKGSAVDIWAMGVVLYIMVSSYVPFPSPDRIRSLRWDWPPGMVVSESLTKLLLSIFKPSSTRATMDMLLINEWGMEGFAEPIRYTTPTAALELDAAILTEMEHNYGWSHEAVLHALSDDNASSQIGTTYALLEFKKQKQNVKKNPIWVNVGGQKGASKKQQAACVLQ